MSLTIETKPKPKRDPIPAGVKAAVCSGIIDLGEQDESWEGKSKIVNKVMFTWEVPSATIDTEDGPIPRSLNRTYTASMGDRANLRKMVQSWLGKDLTDEEARRFDLRQMLGKGCMLNIVHKTNDKGEVFAKVDSVMGLPEEMPVPKASRLLLFDLDDPDALDAMALLPEWVQDRIKKGNTYARLLAKDNAPWEPDTGDVNDSDLPF